MNELTLKWIEANQLQIRTLHPQQPSKHPGTIRIGRDPHRCDVVLSHPTVSGLHVEIFFDTTSDQFRVRSLRDSNPPRIDGQLLSSTEATLNPGSHLCLGQVELEVVSISTPTPEIPPTILLPPNPVYPIKPQTTSPQYGLQCPKCDRLTPYEQIDLGCRWCGTSLASAISVVLGDN
ncbi:FHA domain-containing protein [Capilliphycus salinus ALCB114379]|uniref:FHA domain-containing protein n=1 Tax=Capilliphycus salinus TaxID=2768948 RepID=UPI0039A66826